MSNPTLKRGDKGKNVKMIQSAMNKTGAMLIVDGDFGAGTERAVKYTQNLAGFSETGVVDDALWNWTNLQTAPFPKLHTDGVAFTAKEETGGLYYYNRVTRFPHFPGEASGITIGVGYDLRFKSKSEFRKNWKHHLSNATFNELSKDIGKKGTKGRIKQLKQKGIEIPFKYAWDVFLQTSLPKFYGKTEIIYPSLPKLPDMCRSVLVSLVFNRGDLINNSNRRREMKAIRNILVKADDSTLTKKQKKKILREVEDQLVSMKRLWAPSSGVYKRRQTEANIWRVALAAW